MSRADRFASHNRKCSGYDRPAPPSRRDFLAQFGTGLGGIALASLLSRDGVLKAAEPLQSAVGARPAAPHLAPKAKRAIQIFLQGGLSQVDSFDYKPELEKHHGQSLAGEQPDVFFGKIGLLHKSHFAFKQRGNSGLWVSDLFPHVAEVADELTLIRSMVAESGNHTPATYQINSGFKTLGFPAMGAWLSYGLGSSTDNLPTFVVIADARGVPTNEANNWTSAFLPAEHQGVLLRGAGTPVNDLVSARPVEEKTRLARYALLDRMNSRHLADRGGGGANDPANDALAGRIRSYALAARMQAAVPEAANIDGETEHTKRLYGLNDPDCADFARSALLARRLLERGVRFVQLWSGGPLQGATWDAHDDVPGNHSGQARRIDRPVAGLLRDLRQRGMLDDTLVIFNTEFGRTPFAQTDSGKLGTGRDHNQTAFTCWLAGAGLKPGYAFGNTDAVGYKSVENPVTVYDFHATVLHLLGVDHEKLTYYHNGIQRRLTNVHGQIVRDLLA